MCRSDVTTDMADAKEQLDDGGEDACANCMAVSNEVIAELDAADVCGPDAAQQVRLDDACGANQEVCAGYP